jgi:hypothetical protein
LHSLDNLKRGQSVDLSLPAGHHIVTVSGVGGRRNSYGVVINGDTTELVATLPALSPGALIVRSATSATGADRAGLDVFIDNRRRGRVGEKIILPAGDYTIRLCKARADGSMDIVTPFTVTITPGATREIGRVATERGAGESCS